MNKHRSPDEMKWNPGFITNRGWITVPDSAALHPGYE